MPHRLFVLIENKTEEIKREEQRENFIEMLTHDLKTPVRAEKRALELLYDGSFGELNSNQKRYHQRNFEFIKIHDEND